MDFPKTKGAGAPACTPDCAVVVEASLEPLAPNSLFVGIDDASFESSLLRRFFLEITSSLPSVAMLPREGIAPVLVPVDDPASLAVENFGIVVDSAGPVADLPPKEKP